MATIVIAETIATVGVDALKAAGHTIHELSGQPRETLVAALSEADALIVRSQVKVDAALIAAGPKLRIIGRAGVGIDNIDAVAAERAGILVVNAPDGNTIAAAEHTFALLLVLARHVAGAFVVPVPVLIQAVHLHPLKIGEVIFIRCFLRRGTLLPGLVTA